MAYLIIAETKNSKPTRTAKAKTLSEAKALVSKLKNDLPNDKKAPNAFYIEDPKVDFEYITVDEQNKTITVDSDKKTRDEVIKEIERLEREITDRRLVEAILGIDDGWLADINALIEAERAKLPEAPVIDFF